LFLDLVRWNIGIAQFPPGRFGEMTAVRKQLAAWNSPFDRCGDYLGRPPAKAPCRPAKKPAHAPPGHGGPAN
jgi:hypothetical protein